MFEILSLFIFLVASLFLVIKSASLAITHSTRVAQSFNLPTYVVGFLVVAVISILPETFIAVTSALEGVPSFGLGTLFGSNVADLSLIFALVVLVSGRNLRVENKVIKNRFLYLGIIAIPIILGLNGNFSRLDGVILIISGLLFYYHILKQADRADKSLVSKFSFSSLFLLVLSLGGLLLGSHLTVKYGVSFADLLGVNPVLVGMFVVGLGTTLPELFFSIKASKNKNDGLALGDLLGTVIADATIVVGVMASISPFRFNPEIVYITGMFMLLATALLLHLMRTGRTLTRKEVLILVFFYLVFVLVEFFVGTT